MIKYTRVKVKATGHQVDIVSSHYDPEKHELVKRVPESNYPRRSKFKVAYQRAVEAPVTSAPEAVEGSALPIQAGTVEEEVGP